MQNVKHNMYLDTAYVKFETLLKPRLQETYRKMCNKTRKFSWNSLLFTLSTLTMVLTIIKTLLNSTIFAKLSEMVHLHNKYVIYQNLNKFNITTWITNLLWNRIRKRKIVNLLKSPSLQNIFLPKNIYHYNKKTSREAKCTKKRKHLKNTRRNFKRNWKIIGKCWRGFTAGLKSDQNCSKRIWN